MNANSWRGFVAVLLAVSLGLGMHGCTFLSTPTGEIGSPRPESPAAGAQGGGSTSRAPGAALVQAAPASGEQAQLGQDLSSAVRRVAEQVRPAVVQITTTQQGVDLFNQPVPQTGVGSGVIYDQAGYVLTNNHVVEDAGTMTVALPDGRTFEGELIGGDPETDLAVVKVDGENLPVAALGDSGRLSVGDWVVAIGNALALPGGPTVTAGVVGALGRTVQAPGQQEAGPFLYDLIQTDAAINPGNSGGPLVNLAGQVVGINTLVAGVAEPGVQAQGIGFAIAINSARPIAQQLVDSGRVVHPFLGIRYTALTPSIARRLGISDGRGIVVLEVVPGSPADQAGLRRQDVIQQVENQQIVDESTLGRVLSTHQPGDRVTLTVRREGQTSQVQVTLGERPRQ
ncbi:MAG: S1C family serine protease [Sphingomonadaceae bacterium]